jgi:hypothetical protein
MASGILTNAEAVDGRVNFLAVTGEAAGVDVSFRMLT